jgi:hypothetical protein
MTREVAISVERLGKSYMVGHESRARYMALRDVVASGVHTLAQDRRHAARQAHRSRRCRRGILAPGT